MGANRDFSIADEDPDKLAYRIREALVAANHHEEFKHYYNNIYPFFKFSVDNERGLVLIRHRRSAKSNLNPQIQRTHARPLEKHLPEATSLMEIIGSAVKFGSESRLIFPSAMLSEEDYKRLELWGREAGWELEAGEGSEVRLIKLVGAPEKDEGG